MSIISLESNGSIESVSRRGPIDSTATSHPRARRMVLYENDNSSGCEVGIWFDIKFIFTRFEQCNRGDGDVKGYDADVHDLIGYIIRDKWPEIELLHAKLLILPYYVDQNEDSTADFTKKIISFIDEAKEFLDHMEDSNDQQIATLYKNISNLIGSELGLLNELILSDYRPKMWLWSNFVQTIQEINFWGISFDITSSFETYLNRKYPSCNFHRRIADRLKSLMDIWIDDKLLLEFHSIATTVETSDDMSGDLVPLPLDMESPCYKISGAMVDSKIGIIQSDGIEIQLAIRFNHNNMVSAKNFNPSIVNEFLPSAGRSLSTQKSHYDRVCLDIK